MFLTSSYLWIINFRIKSFKITKFSAIKVNPDILSFLKSLLFFFGFKLSQFNNDLYVQGLKSSFLFTYI